MKKTLALLLAVAMMVMMFAGCGKTAETAEEAAPAEEETTEAVEATTETEPAAAAPGESGGFQEYPIFEDEEVGFINLSAVYFQPVPMSNGNESIDGFDIHLEADISALENTVGFGVGDWVPYLTVKYTITASDGTVASEGTFMTMSASDGPHYGVNLALPNADTYSLTIEIYSPEENGYLVHTDAETGPGGTFDDYFADGPLTYTFEGWDYVPQEW